MEDEKKGHRPSEDFKGGPFYSEETSFEKPPEELPVFIDNNAKINGDWVVENIEEFGGDLSKIFNHSKCMDCLALQDDQYGGGHESPCIKCETIIHKIKNANKPS